MSTANETVTGGFALKPLHIVGMGIIMLAVVFGAFGVQDGFRSYTTSVVEASESGRHVQLAGFLGSLGEYDEQGRWTFMLQDENGKMVKVISDDPRPANFEQAISIVAIGRYDEIEGAFVADDLLVKCPSKYQETAS
ncbi:MAG: cytochrome c maturation protein CcmE [Chloroflexaceae bacterium]|nr:cytochrome c maturation protein CcmE [Chloroflexaceae bacterium]NJO07328.1 cytochrome c maturation protein CcmE [Chloroflexaceae bacterium]NJO84625.1 cytochrome c maturation protein CcmE [Blastochloris sp.]